MLDPGHSHIVRYFDLLVTVPVKTHRNKYKKKDVCYYCDQTFESRITKHYKNIHHEKERVKSAMLESDPQKKKDKLYMLQHQGNWKYNCKVCMKLAYFPWCALSMT